MCSSAPLYLLSHTPPPDAAGDAVAVFVLLHGNCMDVGARRRLVLVIER